MNRPARLRSATIGLTLLVSVACAGEAIDAPSVPDLSGIDPEGERLIRSVAAEAAEAPGDANLRGRVGMALDANGLARASIEHYDAAARLAPSDPQWPYLASAVRATLGDTDEAIEGVDRVLALDPGYVPANLFRGQWLLDLGRAEEARDSYRKATELDPDQVAGWYGLARAELRAGNPSAAVELLEGLAGRRAADPYLQQLLGLAYRDAGDMDKARLALSRGTPQQAPGWRDPWRGKVHQFQVGFGASMQKAEKLINAGRFQEAIDQLEPLRETHPADPALTTNLSIAYRNVGRTEEAFQLLLDGLETDPEFFGYHLNISAAYQRKGDIERALHHLDRTIEINPSLGTAYERRGLMLMQSRRLDEALRDFSAALNYDARSPTTLIYKGLVQAELRQWEDAAETLEAATQTYPTLDAAHIGLALVRIAQGRWDDAENSLNRAEELNPGSRRLAAARQRLEARRAGSQ